MDGYDMLILSAYIMMVLLLITLADFNLTVAVKVNSCTYSPLIIAVSTSLCNTLLFLTDKLVIPIFASVFGDFTDNSKVWQGITLTLCRMKELYGVSFYRFIW